MNDRIYLDYAATAPMFPEAVETMLPFLKEAYGNPSGIYGTGREAHKTVENARRQVARLLDTEPATILFTSGGSESDNMALKGTAFAMREKGKHLITTAIEHHAVLKTCGWLEKQGFEVTYLPVNREGRVDPDDVRKAIRRDTVLVSVMYANNEIGSLEPIEEIGGLCREHGVLFHTDAVQAAGMIPISMKELPVDLMSISAHKMHGPKGIGALYIRKGTRLDALVHGGAQERGLRAGTENVAGIAGFGKAAEINAERMKEQVQNIRRLRDELTAGILEKIPEVRLNGDPKNRLPNNCHFSFRGIESETLVLRMDLAGIAVSGGSACTSGSTEPSHVLQAIGLEEELQKGSIRLTLGRETTPAEIKKTAQVLPEIVSDLRSMRNL